MLRIETLVLGAMLPVAAALFSPEAPAESWAAPSELHAVAPLEQGDFVARYLPRRTLAEARTICTGWMQQRYRQVNGQMRLGVPRETVRAQLGEPDYDAGTDRPLWVYRLAGGELIALLFCDKGEYVLNAYQVSHAPDRSKGTGLSSMGPMKTMLWMSGC